MAANNTIMFSGSSERRRRVAGGRRGGGRLRAGWVPAALRPVCRGGDSLQRRPSPGADRVTDSRPQQDGPATPCAAATPGPAQRSADRAQRRLWGGPAPSISLAARSPAPTDLHSSVCRGSRTSTDSQHVTKQYYKTKKALADTKDRIPGRAGRLLRHSADKRRAAALRPAPP